MSNDSFQARILHWYRLNGRDLPWRHTRDPYAIWLSEVILQQTRIDQGRDYWQRFVHRWPRVDDLAAASEDEVLLMWQGLGYYSRARNLLAAARQVVAMGGFPADFKELKALKGVGDYTAAAIASIAFGLPVATVDGNVYRVLSRHYGIDTPIDTTAGRKTFAALAQSLLPVDQAAAFNQAMMDFGATCCTPRSPRCSQCPLEDTCEALHSHRVDQLPAKLKSARVTTRYFQYVYLRCDGCTAIHRREAGDIWQGLYEPVLYESATATAPGELRAMPHLDIAPGARPVELCHAVKHQLTHRTIYADFYLLATGSRPALPPGYFWIEERERDRYAMPRLVERLLETLP